MVKLLDRIVFTRSCLDRESFACLYYVTIQRPFVGHDQAARAPELLRRTRKRGIAPKRSLLNLFPHSFVNQPMARSMLDTSAGSESTAGF